MGSCKKAGIEEAGIECIVASYEADPQLTHLLKTKRVAAVIAEDSAKGPGRHTTHPYLATPRAVHVRAHGVAAAGAELACAARGADVWND